VTCRSESQRDDDEAGPEGPASFSGEEVKVHPLTKTCREMAGDARLRRLSPAHRWLWVVLVGAADDAAHVRVAPGLPYSTAELADAARMSEADVQDGLASMCNAGLLSPVADGYEHLAPCLRGNTSTERVRRWREQQKEGPEYPEELQLEQQTLSQPSPPEERSAHQRQPWLIRPEVAPNDLRDLWNAICAPRGLELVKSLGHKLFGMAQAACNDIHTRAEWEQIMRAVADNPWLCGANDSGWRASLYWLLSKDNAHKALAGAYSRGSARQSSGRLSGPAAGGGECRPDEVANGISRKAVVV